MEARNDLAIKTGISVRQVTKETLNVLILNFIVYSQSTIIQNKKLKPNYLKSIWVQIKLTNVYRIVTESNIVIYCRSLSSISKIKVNSNVSF